MEKLMKSLSGLKGKSSTMLLVLAIGVVGSFILLYFMDNQSNGSETPSMSTAMSSPNSSNLSDFEMVLSQIEGAGMTRAYITYDSSDGVTVADEVKGIVIVSQGAGDLRVRVKLLNAASTAFDVPADKIEVFEMKKGELP